MDVCDAEDEGGIGQCRGKRIRFGKMEKLMHGDSVTTREALGSAVSPAWRPASSSQGVRVSGGVAISDENPGSWIRGSGRALRNTEEHA